MSEVDFNDQIHASLHPIGCNCGAHERIDLEFAPSPGADAVLADNGKEVFTLPQIISQLTRSGDFWNGINGNPTPIAGLGTITYGFFNQSFEVYSSERNRFQPLSEPQRTAVRDAFAIYDDLIAVTFVEGPVSIADINLGNIVSEDSYYSAYANYPDFDRTAGDIWFNTNAATNSEIGLAQPGFRTILHEIGHALGIAHPGNYNATEGVTITYANNAEYYQDSYEYTIMSYFGSSNTGAIRDAFAATPMAHDIAAIQAIYGADMTTRTGDTIYGFNSNTGRNYFDFSLNIMPVIAIWDAGGIDTLDFSGWTSASNIDLAAGGFSDGGGQTSNVQIAFGALIENAVGGGGGDIITGNAAANRFFLQFGGVDVVSGLDGDDAFYFGGALTTADMANGGAGADTLAVQGQYAGLVLGDIQGVEVLLALPGNDQRFGYLGGASLSYDITSADGNVAAGGTLTIQATELRADENLVFDGGAENDGHFRVFAGIGTDEFAGGKGSDGFFFGNSGNFTGADRVDGGDGADSIAMRGVYDGVRAVTFEAASFVNIEALVFLSGLTNEFGGFIVPTGFDYSVTLVDGNVAAGQRLDVFASTLASSESLTFDGRAESDGAYRVFAGAGEDWLRSGAGSDFLYGALGADRLEGGAGSDTYVYRFVPESTGSAFDTIAGLDSSTDRIDLVGNADGVAAVLTAGSLSAASFDTDLAAALGGALGAGQALVFTADQGDFAGRTFLVADANNIAGYQAGQDFVIELVTPTTPIEVGMDFLI